MSIKTEIGYNSTSFIERLMKEWGENQLGNIDQCRLVNIPS